MPSTSEFPLRTATAFLAAATTVKGFEAAAAMERLEAEKLRGLPKEKEERNGRAEEDEERGGGREIRVRVLEEEEMS